MKIFKDDNSLKNEGRENIILTLDKEKIVNTKIALWGLSSPLVKHGYLDCPIRKHIPYKYIISDLLFNITYEDVMNNARNGYPCFFGFTSS